MNRRIATVIAAGTAGAFAFALPLVALPKGTENYNKSGDTVIECTDGNELVFHAPSNLWPPNHKYYDDITVTYTDDEPENTVTLTTTGTHDGYDGDTGTETNGSGNTADDITSDDNEATIDNSDPNQPVASEAGQGTVTTDWDARAERSGRIKEGRTYTLSANATSSDGETCEGFVQMHVPHDMRKSNR